MKFIILLLVLVPVFGFSATERVIYAGSRSTQEIYLEEDFFRTIQINERVPVTQTICSDLPVTQNYCEWLPSQRICQTRPVCHATPYGPRCFPTYGCYDTPPRQYCRPVTTVQRRCAEQTTYQNVTRTERRFMYRGQANISLTFNELPREYSFIEFDVSLIDEQLLFSSEDFQGPIIVAKLMEINDGPRGIFNRRYEISTIGVDEFYSPVSQIPELLNHNGNFFNIKIGETKNRTDIKVQVTLRHLRTGVTRSFSIQTIELRKFNDESEVEFSLANELGRDWPYWRGNFRELYIRVQRVVDGEVVSLGQDRRPMYTQNWLHL